MSSLRIGCDLCQVNVIEQMLKEQDGSLERLFNAQEREYAMAQGNPAHHLAGVFAAKEALAKALKQPGLLGTYNKEVTIGHQSDGAPTLRLSGGLSAAFAEQGIRIADLSISHDGDYAMAAVVVEGAGPLKCHRCHLSLEYLSEQKIADVLLEGRDKEGFVRYLCPVCLRGW